MQAIKGRPVLCVLACVHDSASSAYLQALLALWLQLWCVPFMHVHTFAWEPCRTLTQVLTLNSPCWCEQRLTAWLMKWCVMNRAS